MPYSEETQVHLTSTYGLEQADCGCVTDQVLYIYQVEILNLYQTLSISYSLVTVTTELQCKVVVLQQYYVAYALGFNNVVVTYTVSTLILVCT